MNITFGMIVFQMDFVLRQALEAIYPYAHKIIVAEGPVKYWQDRGYETSTDRTNEILEKFPDPDKKLRVIHGQWNEKEEQSAAYAGYIPPETDYLWHLDADEVYKPEDIDAVLSFLWSERPTSLGFKLCTFFGGFDNVLTGFEANYDTVRLLRWSPGAQLVGHRPPRLDRHTGPMHHVPSHETFERTGAQIYHYSYVWPQQVWSKVGYYRSRVPHLIIPGYYDRVWLPWARGTPEQREAIENEHDGVHEFIPSHRGPCRTTPFTGTHPPSIAKDLPDLRAKHRAITGR